MITDEKIRGALGQMARRTPDASRYTYLAPVTQRRCAKYSWMAPASFGNRGHRRSPT
jgi:hypothetical protein